MKPGWELCQPGALIKAPSGVKTSVESFVTELNIVCIHHSQQCNAYSLSKGIFVLCCFFGERVEKEMKRGKESRLWWSVETFVTRKGFPSSRKSNGARRTSERGVGQQQTNARPAWRNPDLNRLESSFRLPEFLLLPSASSPRLPRHQLTYLIKVKCASYLFSEREREPL